MREGLKVISGFGAFLEIVTPKIRPSIDRQLMNRDPKFWDPRRGNHRDSVMEL